MKNLPNLEKALVVAVANPEDGGQKILATFLVKEQIEDTLKALLLWCNDNPESEPDCLIGQDNAIHELKIDDIWWFPTSVTKAEENALKEKGLEIRFYNDEKPLERLAVKLGMDKMNIGYEGESEDGTWFTCCRIEPEIKKILPGNYHVYSLRSSDDDDSQAASIETQVVVNHYGDILCGTPLPVPIELEIDSIEYYEEGNIICR